ncbi:SDR family NAD(P)-dependent oxidoreductase [Rhizobium mayense]|uniref:SDR family oxidoreductase n=1 Tax=Rhizobium mayense TaxID=1312184 RepID=A0ABT7K5H0_9HYPH|nr:SDR family oxidoreductase [Rhizobium mayense]MDL2403751.1 SDR family oxidoreductase [Rhizobium mayense]
MVSRIAIVTGASSGIGAATALRLAGRYRGLVLHARKSSSALEEIADQVRAAGTEAVTLLGNLTDASFGSRLVDAARVQWGQLDCVVANAGFPILKAFEEGTVDDLDYAFKGNVYSLFALARAASPLLKHSDSGRIVAVGSFTSHVFRTDIRQFPMSAASKGAVETAVRSLAMHFADHGVTVNCVVPGFVRKPSGSEDSVSDEELEANLARIPLKRAGQPKDVAAAIEFLLSEDASYITGQSLHVNGGLI